MHSAFVTRGEAAEAIPIWFVSASSWRDLRQSFDGRTLAYVDAAGFEPKPGRFIVLPGSNGEISGALFGLEALDDFQDRFLPGRLSDLLPAGTYRFANAPHDPRLASLAFALGSYRFTRYAGAPDKDVRLALPEGIDGEDLSRIADGVALARDLINTPANDMGPAEVEQAARALAKQHGATLQTIEGDDLLGQNYPLIHAVGRAAARAPRLIDLRWGDPGHPKVTLVGKGVCFDSGGLDIKPESGMRLMKKDMGGAASVLALAHMLMDRGVNLRLRVLIPAVENAISGSAFRPLDVYRARTGVSVEIGNTDAEGRLILADALAAADEEKPELLIDLGTLTGAARVALGPDLPPFYTDDEGLAAELAGCAAAENDPLWRLPLWPPYKSMLDSKVADISNVGSSSFAGSITCALFLQRFVAAAEAWLHIDIYAWTPTAKPARPEGGECQAARALYALLAARYG
ncbi:MAG: leucyl aminopeptidase family protein [Xanthobacteraceae bacterium]